MFRPPGYTGPRECCHLHGDNSGVSAEHYFTAEPGARDDRHEVRFSLLGRDFRLVASRGVFSSGRLDPGTSVLLHKAPLPRPDSRGPMLDLGCGYGPITVVLAGAAPSATVYSVDVNRRALELVRQNAAAAGAGERVVAAEPDDVPEDVRFAEIWSNPPIRVGKAELHAMLDRWLPRLAPDGVAWLVVARHLGGDSLQKHLVDRGFPTERHASQKGYRVLEVRKAGDARPPLAENA
jgi:16S rRNA (guanine1207-N2)-methyltransferase